MEGESKYELEKRGERREKGFDPGRFDDSIYVGERVSRLIKSGDIYAAEFVLQNLSGGFDTTSLYKAIQSERRYLRKLESRESKDAASR